MADTATYTEDWYSGEACLELAGLVRQTNHLSGRVVEIGCWEGKSTEHIANAAAPDAVHAVDTWEGSPGEISAELARERDVYKTFTENIARTTAGNVHVHRMDWRTYLARDRSPVRFCHIDATHTYQEVADNINAVWPLIEEGGILCGDDAGHPPVRQAVLDTLGDDVDLAAGRIWWYQKRKSHNRDLATRYRQACTTPSDIFEHLPVFVDMCLELDAQKVIELGTRGGVSTIAWLYGLDQTGGRLWSVDIDPLPDLPYSHWTALQGDDLDPNIVNQLPDSADIVFIDTSHSFEDTLSELNVYLLKVRPGGKIALHDTELRRPGGLTTRQPDFPVKQAIELFCHEEGLCWENLPNCFGLGVISVP